MTPDQWKGPASHVKSWEQHCPDRGHSTGDVPGEGRGDLWTKEAPRGPVWMKEGEEWKYASRWHCGSTSQNLSTIQRPHTSGMKDKLPFITLSRLVQGSAIRIPQLTHPWGTSPEWSRLGTPPLPHTSYHIERVGSRNPVLTAMFAC